MQQNKMVAGASFPQMSWPTVDGGKLDLAGGTGWRLLVVYRGKHCPLCKGYLRTLNELSPAFEAAGIAVSVLSADPQEKAQADVTKYGWKFPVGHDLTPDQMRELGLYISEPLSDKETDRPFAEPGLFVINPDGKAQIIDISNAPFVRPDLQTLLGGLQFVIARDYPVRGQA